jgi:tagatose-6-phosphate ketose/aldose isomerase
MPQPSGSGLLLTQLGGLSEEEQFASGYGHTLREICQQPELWSATASRVAKLLPQLALPQELRSVVLTGSGSSCYAGRLIQSGIQEGMGISASSCPAGDLVLHGSSVLPLQRPSLLVSLARSGNSPESTAVIRGLLAAEPEVHHLVITCNPAGQVVHEWRNGSRDERVHVVTLDDRSCDRSLVMTSSFTNLALAGLGLGFLNRSSAYTAHTRRMAKLGRRLLSEWSDTLADVASSGYYRLIALGDGAGFGAAQETALKTLEMTDGRVMTMAESSLGFRHGPMCALKPDTLLVVFFSSDPLRRAYQSDLLDEIRRKGLGGRKVVVGEGVPRASLESGDVAVDLPGLNALPDEFAGILHVLVGQLLGFFRCRVEGLRPDEPASSGAISRVVPAFPLHGALAKVPS